MRVESESYLRKSLITIPSDVIIKSGWRMALYRNLTEFFGADCFLGRVCLPSLCFLDACGVMRTIAKDSPRFSFAQN